MIFFIYDEINFFKYFLQTNITDLNTIMTYFEWMYTQTYRFFIPVADLKKKLNMHNTN